MFFLNPLFPLQLKTPQICLPLLPLHLLQSTLVLWNKVGQEHQCVYESVSLMEEFGFPVFHD